MSCDLELSLDEGGLRCSHVAFWHDIEASPSE